LPPLDLGKFQHARDDVGLRDGLPGLDRQRGILIGEFLQMLGHEGLARHGAHGGKQQRIVNAAGAEMAGDHHRPLLHIGAVQDFGALHGHDDKTTLRVPGSALI
jgi:hypothetical protein